MPKSAQKYLLDWLTFSSEPSDEQLESIDACVKRIYEQLELDEPQIIWCSGPMEQLLLPTLVELMLRLGREQSSALKFKGTIRELDAVHQEWSNLWTKALSSIDWEKVIPHKTGCGPLISERIERMLDRSVKPTLLAQVDQKLGMSRHQKVEKHFNMQLARPYQSLKRAVMYHGADLQLLWERFVFRLPEPFLAEINFIIDSKAKGLPFDRTGPTQDAWSGGWDWCWLASCDFARQHLGCELQGQVRNHLDLWMNIALGASGYLFSENSCFVHLKPTLIFFDEQERLHHGSGPAVEFIDGTQLFFWHGIEVPDEVIVCPQKMKIKTIESERNIEIRRIMIERYGLQEFLRDSAARKIQEDEYGALFRKEMPGDEPMLVVKVMNSTPEPDGTYRNYFLRVPPRITTAREAVAWTFQMTEEDYKPIIET